MAKHRLLSAEHKEILRPVDSSTRDAMLDSYDSYYEKARHGMFTENPNEETIIIQGIVFDQSPRVDALIKRRLIKSMLSFTVTYSDEFAESIRQDETFHLIRKYHPEILEELIEHSLEFIPKVFQR